MARIILVKNDIGTKIKLDADTIISTATTLRIKYKKPGGTTGFWPAILEGTQYAYYITTDGDLDEAGRWDVQLYVIMPTWRGHGKVAKFHVYNRVVEDA